MSHESHRRSAPASISVAIITVSDSRTPENDESGALIRALAEKAGHRIAGHSVVPDDIDRVRAAIGEAVARPDVEAVLLNGGTGMAPRDRTIEAVVPMLGKRLDGFGELFRSLSYERIGPAAMLSRAIAGLVNGRAVFCMPGSPAAVRLAMEKLILPEMGHLIAEAARDS